MNTTIEIVTPITTEPTSITPIKEESINNSSNQLENKISNVICHNASFSSNV
jgi:hypothetical protein